MPAARAVGALLAPVVACLRGDDDGVGILLDGACEDGAVAAAVRAAPAVVRVYLRLAPPPDGADRILTGYGSGALDRFHDREIVTLGAECLEVARVDPALAPIAEAVFVDSCARPRSPLRARRRRGVVLVVRAHERRSARRRSGRGSGRDLPLPRPRRVASALPDGERARHVRVDLAVERVVAGF